MAIRVVKEQGLEVAGARGEDYLVGTYRRSLRARQCHVHQWLRLQQLTEHTQQVALMIIPPQAVMVTSHVCTARNPAADEIICTWSVDSVNSFWLSFPVYLSNVYIHV